MTVQLESGIPTVKDGKVEVLPAIPEDKPKLRFTFAAFPIDTSQINQHKVTSQYCEDEWLKYIGPIALLVARRMDNHLAANASSGAVLVKEWARTMGVDSEEVVKGLNRLARYGLGEWKSDAEFLLRRHWPTVPLAIATPPHREALIALAD
jgi:hypothetical protein